MTGQIPSSTQWERPNDRPADRPIDPKERSLRDWADGAGYTVDVIVDRGGRGVAVVLCELFDLDVHRVFRADTRKEALTDATSWALSQDPPEAAA